MFPLTSKMNDKFPLTQDINSGVSGHVETVALLCRIDFDNTSRSKIGA